MNPRLTRGEYWLLESVVSYGLPVSMLIDPDLDIALNKPSHGMPPDEVLDTLARLFAERLLVASMPEREEYFPAREEVKRLMVTQFKRYDDRTYFSLTPKGGAVWEAFARPNWELFIEENLDDDSATGTVLSPGRRTLEMYLRHHSCGWFKIVRDSVRIESKAHQEVTYWKTLEQAWVASFSYTVQKGTHGYDKDLQLKRYWLSNMARGWYHWR